MVSVKIPDPILSPMPRRHQAPRPQVAPETCPPGLARRNQLVDVFQSGKGSTFLESLRQLTTSTIGAVFLPLPLPLDHLLHLALWSSRSGNR